MRQATSIIVLGPDAVEARQIADWLRSAGLDGIATVRTCDEPIFMLGRRSASLLIIDGRVPALAEARLLRHIADAAAFRAGPGCAVGRAEAAKAAGAPTHLHDAIRQKLDAAHQSLERATALWAELQEKGRRDWKEFREHLAEARSQARKVIRDLS